MEPCLLFLYEISLVLGGTRTRPLSSASRTPMMGVKGGRAATASVGPGRADEVM